MKFLFINTGTVDQNAGIIRCLGLGKKLVQLNHSVTILISGNLENRKLYGAEFEGITFVYTKIGSGSEQVDKLFKLFKIGKVDFIHCMGIGSSIFFPALIYKYLFRNRVKLILDFEDKQSLLVKPVEKSKIQFYEKLGIRLADIIICASQQLANDYARQYGKKIFYLPFAIDKVLVITEHEKVEHEIRIGYLGNLIEPYKEQFDMLFDVVELSKSKEQDIQLYIAGKGGFEDKLKQKAGRAAITDRVHFEGFISDDDLPAFFSKIDVLVFYLPDNDLNRYRCPNKAFLYSSTGLPIVASGFGEVRTVLKNYNKAVFFDNNAAADHFMKCIIEANGKKGIIDRQFYDENKWDYRTQQYLGILGI